MVSFRKLFPVLAVIALLATVATASAQSTSTTCTVSSTQPAIRLEGLTEPVGTITLSCPTTGLAAGTVVGQGNFRVSSNGPSITNTINTNNVTDARLSVNGGTANTTGVLTSDGKAIDWTAIPLTINAGGTGIDIAISNVRVNAQQTGGAFSTVTFGVFGFNTAASGSFTLGLNSNTTNVATVQKGLSGTTGVTVQNAVSTLSSCGSVTVPSGGFTLGASDTTITFTANFPNAIQVGNTLVAKFSVPTGATLYVGNTNVVTGAFATNSSDNYAYIAADSSNTAPSSAKYTSVTATSGVATVSWYVSRIVPNATFAFPVKVAFGTQSVAAASTVAATGELGPISTVTAASSSSSVPTTRFADVTAGVTGTTLFTFNACTSTLLFPYVVTNTSASGPAFDTGIAITNPTADVLTPGGNYLFSGSSTASAGQPGKCTLYFQGAGAPATATVTTASNIAAGSTYAFLMSGGTESSGAAANFSGYVIAQCSFANAQGFAYIFDSSKTTNLGAMGYLAVKNPFTAQQ